MYNRNLNNAKEIFIAQMLQEGIITEEQYIEMCKHAIVLTPKGFLGSLFNKWFKKSDEELFVIVKVLNLKLKDEEAG